MKNKRMSTREMKRKYGVEYTELTGMIENLVDEIDGNVKGLEKNKKGKIELNPEQLLGRVKDTLKEIDASIFDEKDKKSNESGEKKSPKINIK